MKPPNSKHPTMMEETRATSKRGVEATKSKVDSTPDGIPVFEKIVDSIAQHDGQNVRISKDINGRPITTNSQECHSDVLNDNATPAIDFMEEVRMEIESLAPSVRVEGVRPWEWGSPGAYCVEGPGLLLHTPVDRRVSMRTSNEGGEGAALDSVLVQEDMVETGATTCEPSNRLEMELVAAKILPDMAGDQRTMGFYSKLVCMVTCLGLVAAAVLLPIFLVPYGSHVDDIGRPSGSSSSGLNTDQSFSPGLEQPPTFNDTMNPPFQNTLNMAILKDIGNPATPFFWANRWMLADPNLNRYSSERQRQRFYLAMVYYATNGDGWFHKNYWMSYGTSECHWFSSSSLPKDSAYFIPDACNNNESLISLSLSHNNLTGSLSLFPTALLPHLRVFDVGDNNLRGALPPVISNPNLEALILSKNNFSESLRAGDGRFEFSLKVAMTDGNVFTSGFPNREGLLLSHMCPFLEVLNSTGNHYSGSLPTELGLCTNLIYFGRGNNVLTGSIPSELGLLSRLQHLDVGGNVGVNGTIPTELAALTLLTHLDLAGTSIIGPIPDLLCKRVEEGTLEIEVNCSLVDCCE
jgi:Leucine-rich repeat (LRR) protein